MDDPAPAALTTSDEPPGVDAIASPAPPPPPPYKLYDRKSIVLATFLGSPMAGGWLMALNYRRLGDRRTFWTCLILSFVGTAALIGVGAMLPDKTPTTPFAIAGIIAMAAIAKLQAPQIDEHRRVRGGQLASRWKAAGIGAIFFVLIGGIVLGAVVLTGPPLFSKVAFGVGEEVYYQEQATRADAQKLGEFLQKAGFFDGKRPKTVMLSKNASGTTVSFVVSESAAKDPAVVEAFSKLRLQLQASSLDDKITFRFCDPNLKLLRQIP